MRSATVPKLFDLVAMINDMSESSSFVHLQLHSEYSLLEGAVRIPRLLNYCEEHSVPAIALTDNGNYMAQLIFILVQKRGINPILGTEVYFIEDMDVKSKTRERIILLCQNLTGYQNLCHILTEANFRGFYYQPRIDLDLLKNYNEGLIAISSGYWGPVAQMLQMQFVDKAQEMADSFTRIFGDRFYLGLQRTGELGADQVCQDSIDLARKMGVPVVALNDVYFMNSDEGWMQDLLFCIKTGREVEIDDQNNSKRSNHYLQNS